VPNNPVEHRPASSVDWDRLTTAERIDLVRGRRDAFGGCVTRIRRKDGSEYIVGGGDTEAPSAGRKGGMSLVLAQVRLAQIKARAPR
jgi:hypothetical protein